MKSLVLCFMGMLLILIALWVYADYRSGKFENTWYWLPSAGEPVGYIVEKTTDSGVTWEVIGAAVEPTLVDYRGAQVVMFTCTSEKEESYQLRICAYDEAGNKSPYSIISDVLCIKLSPGKPKIVVEE